MKILVTSVSHETFQYNSGDRVEHIGFEGKSQVDCMLLITGVEPAKASFILDTNLISQMNFQEIAKHIHGLVYKKWTRWTT